MALALAALFGAGGAIGAISLLLPHPDAFNDGALWSNIAIACGAAAALALTAGRLPPWAMQVSVALGTLAITRAVYYSGEPSGFYTFFYIWVGLYVFFFFGRFWGTLQMVLVGATFAWVLTEVQHSAPVGRWLMTVGTIAISGVLIDVLARRVRDRAAEAASRERMLAAVDGVAHELARSTTPEAAGVAICVAATEVTDASGSSLWEPTSDSSGLEVTAATDPELKGARVVFIGQPSGAVRAFTSRKPFFVGEARDSAEVDQRLVERLGVSSVLFQPVLQEGSPIGVLITYWREAIASLDPEVAQTVALISAEASIAIERAQLMDRLERAARTDDLTGLLNRRAWDEYLEREISRARRSGAPLCVAFLDLDRFKDYNDGFGHQAGDRLLKQAAAAWGERLRDTDLLARYGGDEFAVALLDCELEEAVELLERLREATPEDESSSAGVVCWDRRESASELITRADRLLYAAKNGGRDRVVGA